MKIGMVGLGRMGGNMAERLRRSGHEVVGYDRNPEVADVKTLRALTEALPVPRVVWVMVPAGEPTRSTIAELGELLEAGDLVIDGGNSFYRDSIAHSEALAANGVGFVDAGVSGGVWGLENGYGLMVGGDAGQIDLIRPVLEALAPEGGLVHAGPVGAGHFTKMVHNGIEYGLMQAYAEGMELLGASELGIDVPGAVEAWRHGTVVRSWLLDLLARALEDDPGLTQLKGWADDSGEGRWTVQEAVRLAVPAPAISAALYARFASRQEESPAMKVIAALRQQFGGHAVRTAGVPGAPPGK
ncbi:MAG TPA: decarboxylating 6-phosphogluconate dehydrogenase [Acidimicrobiia bacterium]|nr:decarboxylating 6-phosphogluconate dehydrogenase [Acidimicrobiia bacterium]